MSNDLITQSGFAQVAALSQQSAIVGDLLKFVKGRFLAGPGGGEEVPLGTEVECQDAAVSWVRFQEGHPPEYRDAALAREELGETDETKWPIGNDGQPYDPWKRQFALYLLQQESGREFTFATQSWGGRSAIQRLTRQTAVKRRAYPHATPMVKLGTTFKQNPKFGPIAAPVFEVVGWNGIESAVPLGHELNDAIPF